MTSVSDNRITHPAPHRTHTVLNQSVPRTDVNEFTLDTVLSDAVRRHDAAWATQELTDVGALVGSAQFQHDAELANTVIPELKTFDRWGNRIDEVEYHPSYHRIISAAVAHGAHTSAWADPKPGANVARAAAFMLFAQIEPGHSCPISMTNAVIPSLDLQPDVAAIWKPRALSRSYIPELDAPGKASAIFGMSMTEKQGGSDVRANTTVAKPAGRGGPGGDYLLTGHKWFCSAPMSDAFLVLAQAEGAGGEGLSCFLLPRILPDGTRNVFRIQRLKNKLGNKSNASSEIELDGTVGVMVGEPGRGVRTIIEMVARTRLDCVLGSAAGMRQSVAEAVWHARHRSAFGAVLADQPAMTSVLADLALESEAATVTALRLARAHDEDASEQERSFRRLATAVAKYWICKRGPHHAYEALECLGGNGYTEDFPLARRYREQPVMAVWEGSGNVIALDVLRAMTREPDSVAAFDAEVNLARGSNTVLDAHLDRVRRQLGDLATLDPASAQLRARTVVESMALALQASLLIRFSPAAVADTFVDARLGPDRTHEYGTLSPAADLRAILSRA
ncbi:acyl-CoA dehydrogenase family protein [Rhodococcus opacus]|uniref:Putative acyl-CoA dehydrogenase n=1 Tax=Rhodococcus opacus (strain B4) TaxID=632772 RepID=C1B754_RHOOB|nr:acyl-CoA dehydrogenase family protein [Rhodococcus opacus]BAH51507.1 putative acyl-CoA dehydrogenase [Rhodococcus opacus B4]